MEEALENGEPKRCLGYGNLEAMEKSNCSHFAINSYFGNVHTKALGIEGALVSPNDTGSICPRVPCYYHPLCVRESTYWFPLP